jgi:GNAT superfamily N-acetyltransferase
MITIRKATPGDATEIIDFQKKMAWETEKMSLDNDTVTRGVNNVFANPSYGTYWIAEDQGNVIASLLITIEWSDWRNSEMWWFQSVYVIPEYRRKGVFKAMYEEIRNEAGKCGVPALRLYVELNNTRAQQTYEALGMTREHYTMYEWMKE